MIKISVDAPLNIIKHITQFKIVQKYKRFHLKVFNNLQLLQTQNISA